MISKERRGGKDDRIKWNMRNGHLEKVGNQK